MDAVIVNAYGIFNVVPKPNNTFDKLIKSVIPILNRRVIVGNIHAWGNLDNALPNGKDLN